MSETDDGEEEAQKPEDLKVVDKCSNFKAGYCEIIIFQQRE